MIVNNLIINCLYKCLNILLALLIVFSSSQFAFAYHIPKESVEPSIGIEQVHKIMLMAHKGNAKALKKWSATADYLTDYIPGHRFELVPLQWKGMRHYIKTGKADFVLSNSGMYVEFEVNYGIERLATLVNKRENKSVNQFGSVIIKRKDRLDIGNIQGLKGKRLMMSNHNAWGGWQLGWMEMLDQGFDPKVHLSQILESGSHDKTVMAVISGEVDAGVCRTDTLERLAFSGKINLNDIAILSKKDNIKLNFPFLVSTPLYPEWPFSASKNINSELKKLVSKALLDMPATSNAAVQGEYTGWTVPANYQPVHDVLRALKVSPYKHYGEVSLSDTLREYWYFIAISLLVIFTTIIFNIKFQRINGNLLLARSELRVKNEKLQDVIHKHIKTEGYLKRADTIIESVNQAIAITDLKVKIIYVNNAYCSMFGYSREELIGKNPSILSSGRQTRKFYHKMWEEFLENDSWSGEIWDRKKSGELLPVLLNLTVIRNKENEPINYTATLTDIESFKQLESQLQRLAYFDGLTGLPNRMLMEDRMKQELLSAKRNKEKMAVLFLDLDAFKEVNDKLGHDQGDILLEIISDRLKQCVRENDMVSRHGGDEFILSLQSIHGPEDVAAIASNIISSVSSGVTLMGQEVFVGASIGISFYPDDAEEVNMLVKLADEAMYKAKEDGKGRYEFYSASKISGQIK